MAERGFLIDNLLARIHFIIEMIWWTDLAPWEFEFSFPDSLIATFLADGGSNRVTSLRTGSVVVPETGCRLHVLQLHNLPLLVPAASDLVFMVWGSGFRV